MGPAIAMEEVFHSMSLGVNTDATLRRLAALNPATLALMHGSSHHGDGAGQLRGL